MPQNSARSGQRAASVATTATATASTARIHRMCLIYINDASYSGTEMGTPASFAGGFRC